MVKENGKIPLLEPLAESHNMKAMIFGLSAKNSFLPLLGAISQQASFDAETNRSQSGSNLLDDDWP